MRPAGRESEYPPLTGPDKKEKTFGPEELLVLAPAGVRRTDPGSARSAGRPEGRQHPCILLATYGNRHYDNAPWPR